MRGGPCVHLLAIRRAAKRREYAERLRRQATDELREQMRRAQSEGVPIARIAREARLSRQGSTTCWQWRDLLDHLVECLARRYGDSVARWRRLFRLISLSWHIVQASGRED
jgi:hypothetical protein